MKICTLGLFVVRLKPYYEDYIRPVMTAVFQGLYFQYPEACWMIMAVFVQLDVFVFKISCMSVTLRLCQCHVKQTHILFLLQGGAGRVVNGAFMVLKGHRSIVNQVRFNPHTYMICSSGVEKVIKVSKWMS